MIPKIKIKTNLGDYLNLKISFRCPPLHQDTHSNHNSVPFADSNKVRIYGRLFKVKHFGPIKALQSSINIL